MNLTQRLASLSIAMLAHAAGAAYTVRDLGTLGGDMSFARAVADNGAVAGDSVIPGSAAYHAFAFTGSGTLIDLGVLPGKAQSQAFGFDAAGRIIGLSAVLGDAFPRSFRWDAGVMTDLGDFEAHASNPAGTVIVGQHTVLAGTSSIRTAHACFWQAGVITDLPTLGGLNALALDVNAAGVIVGSSSVSGNLTSHACAWIGGTPVDLGVLAGTFSQANAINAFGGVAGVSSTAASGGRHAFLFTINAAGGVTSRTDLGVLPGATESAARDINDAGVIVGVSGGVGFIWQSGAMTDVNALLPTGSGWLLGPASAISNAGHIVGWGMHNGLPRAYLLTPACPGDIDGDGAIGLSDVAAIINCWSLPAACNPSADLDGDGLVGLSDIGVVIQNWGTACP